MLLPLEAAIDPVVSKNRFLELSLQIDLYMRLDLEPSLKIVPLFQIISHSGFSRYIAFAMHLGLQNV